jgi:hypothetical protein
VTEVAGWQLARISFMERALQILSLLSLPERLSGLSKIPMHLKE